MIGQLAVFAEVDKSGVPFVGTDAEGAHWGSPELAAGVTPEHSRARIV